MTVPVKPTDADRLLRAFRKLVLSCMPQLVYWIAHEYTVIESDGATFSGLPTDADFSPQLPTRVPYAPSLAGSQCIVPQGTLAHVVFINADASKPRCVGFDLPSVPTGATVDASGTVAVGPSASAVKLANGTIALAIGAELYHVVCYGDNVAIQVVGPAAAGTILQNPLTAPNPISKVTAQ